MFVVSLITFNDGTKGLYLTKLEVQRQRNSEKENNNKIQNKINIDRKIFNQKDVTVESEWKKFYPEIEITIIQNNQVFAVQDLGFLFSRHNLKTSSISLIGGKLIKCVICVTAFACSKTASSGSD